MLFAETYHQKVCLFNGCHHIVQVYKEHRLVLSLVVHREVVKAEIRMFFLYW